MTTPDPVLALQRQFTALQRLNIVYFILAVLALVLCFVQPNFALITLFASLILRQTLGRKKNREYETGMIHFSVLKTLHRYLENPQHRHASIWTAQEIRDVRFLPSNAASGSILCREGATGTYHGRNVTLGDVTLAHTFTVNNKKSHNFVVGCWITVALETDTGLDCRFIGENMVPSQSLKEMLWVESDLKQIGKPMLLKSDWKVVCAEDNQMMPEEGFLVQLDDLHKKTGGEAAVCVQGNRLHILLKGDILAQKINGRIAPALLLDHVDLLPNLPYTLLLSDLLNA